jgi:hypothetical protein
MLTRYMHQNQKHRTLRFQGAPRLVSLFTIWISLTSLVWSVDLDEAIKRSSFFPISTVAQKEDAESAVRVMVFSDLGDRSATILIPKLTDKPTPSAIIWWETSTGDRLRNYSRTRLFVPVKEVATLVAMAERQSVRNDVKVPNEKELSHDGFGTIVVESLNGGLVKRVYTWGPSPDNQVAQLFRDISEVIKENTKEP